MSAARMAYHLTNTSTATSKQAERLRGRHKGRRLHGSVQRDFVRLDSIEQDTLVLRPAPGAQTRRRDYLAVLEIRATNYTLTSAQERRAMIAAFRTLLRTLRFPLQILVHAQRMDLSSYVEQVQRHIEEGGWEERLPVAAQVAHGHERSLALLGRERTLIDRRFFVIVPADDRAFTTFEAWFPRLARGLSRRANRRQQRVTLTEARQSLRLRVSSLTQQLHAMGLTSRRLAGKELADLAHVCLQGEHALRYPLPESLFALSDKPLARPAAPLLHAQPRKQGMDEKTEVVALLTTSNKGIEDTDMEPDEDLDEVLQFPSARDHRLAPADLIALRDLIAPESIEVSSHVLRVGDEYVRGLAVIGFPREIVEGCLAPLLAMDEIVDLSFHFSPQSSADMLRRLLFRREQYAATQRSNLQRGRRHDPEIQVAQADVDTLIEPLAAGEESVLEMGFYLLVRAPSLRTLDERTQRVRSVLHQLLFVVHPTTLEHAEAFRSCLPDGVDTLKRTFTTTSTVAACTFPFISESFSMPDGIFLGVTLSGEPILLNPWALESPNAFIGGMTGSGKSFGNGLHIVHEQLLHPHTQTLILDPSREYAPLVEAFGGTIIRLAAGSAESINPFDLVPHGVEMHGYLQQQRGDRLADKIAQLHTCLDLLLADYVPTPTRLSAREKAMLDRAFYETYRRVGITADPRTHDRPAPLMRDLYDVLRSGVVGQDEYGLADRLERYVHGSLAGLFNRPTSVRLDTNFICFDLSEMRGSRELRPIGMFLIADLIWSQARYQPRPRRCYIDEAWSLIEHEDGGRFLERLAREARKHYLSLVTITQNPEQFLLNPYGSVIVQNALTKVLKRLDSVGARAACDAFGLTQEEEQLLLSMPQNQALLIVGSRRMLVEMNASPEEHALLTTDPRDLEIPLAERLARAARSAPAPLPSLTPLSSSTYMQEIPVPEDF